MCGGEGGLTELNERREDEDGSVADEEQRVEERVREKN